jgi:hypothetical protein
MFISKSFKLLSYGNVGNIIMHYATEAVHKEFVQNTGSWYTARMNHNILYERVSITKTSKLVHLYASASYVTHLYQITNFPYSTTCLTVSDLFWFFKMDCVVTMNIWSSPNTVNSKGLQMQNPQLMYISYFCQCFIMWVRYWSKTSSKCIVSQMWDMYVHI